MIDSTQSQSLNNPPAKPLQNGFDPDSSYVEGDLSSPSSTPVPDEQPLPQSRTTPPKYEGDPAELIVTRMLEQHFANGKHLMLSADGRFWHYDGRIWRPVQDQWIS